MSGKREGPYVRRFAQQSPLDAIDYVITHELCHGAVPHHGPAFYELLGRVMPDWERRKIRLETILA
ncbi:M48 family metallopeptidase [Rubellimicrobium roseum]|uniref:M48 family metallopeptidase n=1 Tax=Rubellimicrobium roseum TaxID=687525 RepID=A0A5C4N4J0_9RHOB|nr:M48 family metallopeptidase [Rubellimicrobium roseum]